MSLCLFSTLVCVHESKRPWLPQVLDLTLFSADPVVSPTPRSFSLQSTPTRCVSSAPLHALHLSPLALFSFVCGGRRSEEPQWAFIQPFNMRRAPPCCVCCPFVLYRTVLYCPAAAAQLLCPAAQRSLVDTVACWLRRPCNNNRVVVNLKCAAARDWNRRKTKQSAKSEHLPQPLPRRAQRAPVHLPRRCMQLLLARGDAKFGFKAFSHPFKHPRSALERVLATFALHAGSC